MWDALIISDQGTWTATHFYCRREKSVTKRNTAKWRSPYSANTANNTPWAILTQGPYPHALLNYLNHHAVSGRVSSELFCFFVLPIVVQHKEKQHAMIWENLTASLTCAQGGFGPTQWPPWGLMLNISSFGIPLPLMECRFSLRPHHRHTSGLSSRQDTAACGQLSSAQLSTRATYWHRPLVPCAPHSPERWDQDSPSRAHQLAGAGAFQG